jgi:hypothetical protein
VKHDDVTHAQPSLEPDPSWLERALVDTLLEAAELPVVAGISVQQVVDALGDPKERRAAADHRPVGVDSSVEPVGRDRPQQLGDPASHRRGVDHPHRAPAQRLAAVGERELQRAPAVLGDHRPKAPEGERRERDLLWTVRWRGHRMPAIRIIGSSRDRPRPGPTSRRGLVPGACRPVTGWESVERPRCRGGRTPLAALAQNVCFARVRVL